MSKFNQRTIGQAIKEFFNTTGMDTKLDELKLIASWEKVAGAPIAKHTLELFIRNRQLFVKLDSAALRQELSFSREVLTKKLNDEVGKTVIENILFQ